MPLRAFRFINDLGVTRVLKWGLFRQACGKVPLRPRLRSLFTDQRTVPVMRPRLSDGAPHANESSSSRSRVARVVRHPPRFVPAKNLVRADAIELAGIERYARFAMTSVLMSLLATLRGIVRSRAALHLEVLALRHQVQCCNAPNRDAAVSPVRTGGCGRGCHTCGAAGEPPSSL